MKIEEELQRLFPLNRYGWFFGRRTVFSGVISEVTESYILVDDVDGFANWAGEEYAVVDRALVRCKPGNLKIDEPVRFRATVIEPQPGVYRFDEVELL